MLSLTHTEMKSDTHHDTISLLLPDGPPQAKRAKSVDHSDVTTWSSSGKSNSQTAKTNKIHPSPQGKKKLIIGNTPRHGTNDFFLPMPDQSTISALFNDDDQKSVHFIRSGVGVGKSTMARYLSKVYDKFVIIEGNDGIENWRKWLIRACGTEKQKGKHSTQSAQLTLYDALKWFETERKVLIFDEAHETFSQPEFIRTLYHDPKINILLFSASAEAVGDQNKIVATPKEITNIYLWRPTVFINKEVIAHLHQAGVYLNDDAFSFILELCGEHFGIALHALEWVKIAQKQSNKIWEYSTTVKEVRKSIHLGWDKPNSFLNVVKRSRAIKVNGGSEPTEKSFYPDVFAKILFAGPGKIDIENKSARKVLTVHGMLFPIRSPTGKESLFKYRDQDAVFCVPHPLMCIFYQRIFKNCHWKPFIKKEYRQPQNCTDLLARVIPHLSFLSVVSAPITSHASVQTKDSTMSKQHNFPHEDQFQHAILKHLWKLGFETLMVMSNDDKIGRPDIVVPCGVKTFVLELLLATRTDEAHKEHILRFQTKSNYGEGMYKCILTIGKNESLVQDKMRLLDQIRQGTTGLHDVEVLGLVPKKAFCYYTLYKFPPRERKAIQHFHFPVDGVSRSTGVMARGHNPISVVEVISLIPRAEHEKMVNQLQMKIALLTSIIKADGGD